NDVARFVASQPREQRAVGIAHRSERPEDSRDRDRRAEVPDRDDTMIREGVDEAVDAVMGGFDRLDSNRAERRVLAALDDSVDAGADRPGTRPLDGRTLRL